MPQLPRQHLILLAQLAAGLVACSGSKMPAFVDSPNVPTLTSINIDAPSSSIVIGGTVQITATPNITASLTWSSANTDKATVSGSGVVTGVAAGAATITVIASAGGAMSSKD